MVITGAGLISPLGNSKESLWESLVEGRSGIDYLSRLPVDHLPSPVGGEARDFSGDIGDYGDLDKALMRSIKKGRKLMCREIEMGVAAAQLALQDAGLAMGSYSANRTGVVFGSDYIMSAPEEFKKGIAKCTDESHHFQFDKWGSEGMGAVDPLWLLKYLPNMPASHIAIYNDLQGPSNSITQREASSNLSVAEAFTTIQRGGADIMIAGSTGTRIHRLRTLHVTLQQALADPQGNPQTCCRPFDLDRSGMVIGEGAGAIVLETLESAQKRGATILGEIITHASTCAARRSEPKETPSGRTGLIADYRRAVSNILQTLLERSGMTPDQIGHYHAHGESALRNDQEEAEAINDVFLTQGVKVPVVAAKSGMGNLGAGSGIVELIGSVMALQAGHLFPIQNYQTADPACPIEAVTDRDTAAGDSFITTNFTPQGQASGLLVRKWSA